MRRERNLIALRNIYSEKLTSFRRRKKIYNLQTKM
ncbi:unnamed protein product, partial [Larinioides sclopetarius]